MFKIIVALAFMILILSGCDNNLNKDKLNSQRISSEDEKVLVAIDSIEKENQAMTAEDRIRCNACLEAITEEYAFAVKDKSALNKIAIEYCSKEACKASGAR